MSSTTVRILTGEWAPYISQGFEGGGVVCHIVREAFARAGLDCEIHYTMPWLDGVYEQARAGLFDATMAWRPTPVRLEDFIASADPVMENRYVLFHRRDFAFDWKRIADLEPFTIAGTHGFNYGDRIREAEAAGKLRMLWSSTTAQSFARLLEGEAELLAHDQAVGHEDIRRLLSPSDGARLSFHPRMTDHHLSHVIFPRVNGARSVELREAFDRGMKTLRGSAELQTWIERFKAGGYGNAPYAGDYWTLDDPLEALA